MRAKWLMACALAAGCNSEATFFDGSTITFALTDETPALVETDEGGLFIVESRVELPVRYPGDAAMQRRREGADEYEDLPFERLPWVRRGDLALEIDYTVANMDEEDANVATHPLVTVTINGINEFHEYVPGFIVDDEDILPDFAQWERTHRLGSFERESFTVREEEIDEVAVDLATVVNGAPNSNQIVYFQNQSGIDERSSRYIPEVVPGLIGVRIGLRTLQQANIVLEASVRVRETESRLLEDDDDELLEVTPVEFRPVAPEEE